MPSKKVIRRNTKGKHIMNPLMEESTNESFDRKNMKLILIIEILLVLLF